MHKDNQKIKVVHVYKDFNVYNGLTEILTIIAQNIDHEKYEFGVCVFRYDGNSFGKNFEKLGGKIFNLNIPKKLYREPQEFAGLYKFFNQYKPHIVQTHVLKSNLYGSLAARLAGVPIVIGTEMTLKDTAPSNIKRIRDKIIHPLVTGMLKHCDKFMVTSNYIKQEWYQTNIDQKFEVIYPPFNLDKYNSAMNGQNVSDNDGSLKIGFVGRLSEEKGIPFFLHSMSKVIQEKPDTKLLIVGTGPLEQSLKKLCDDLEISAYVTFLGHKENVFEILKQLDIFVIPSRTEGCPIVILEAMAMGLPVIATHVGGNPELVIDGDTGILVPYNKPDEMVGAILNMINDKNKAKIMGNRGKELAFSKFHPRNFVNSIDKLYMQLIAEKNINCN